jgi:uncharacterized protein
MHADFLALVSEPLHRGRTLLHYLRDDEEHLLRHLLALPLDINARDDDGSTPLHAAASGGQAAVLRMLVMCNADPMIRNARGQDALMCAVKSRANTMVLPTLPNSTCFSVV